MIRPSRGYHYFYLTLWPWPWSLTHFLKTLTLWVTFEQWVPELWYFTWVFLVIRPFSIFIFLNKYKGFHIAHENFFWQDLPTGIKIFVLVTSTIFGIGHYRGHLCFTNTSCFISAWFQLKLVDFLSHIFMFYYDCAFELQYLNRVSPTFHII